MLVFESGGIQQQEENRTSFTFFWLNLCCAVMSAKSSVTELPGQEPHSPIYSSFCKGKRLTVQPVRARHGVSYQWWSVWRVQPGTFHLCESLKETNQKHEQTQQALVSQLLNFCTSDQKFMSSNPRTTTEPLLGAWVRRLILSSTFGWLDWFQFYLYNYSLY